MLVVTIHDRERRWSAQPGTLGHETSVRESTRLVSIRLDTAQPTQPALS